MGKEIERKFLVKNNSWETGTKPQMIRQGYLFISINKVIRIRINNNKGSLTIKGAPSGLTRSEFEYEIPVSDAEEMLINLCEKPLIEKERSIVNYKNFVWEIDRFKGENKGLIIAEVELESEDQDPPLPDWIGDEVTGDPLYYNSNLVRTSFIKFNNNNSRNRK